VLLWAVPLRRLHVWVAGAAVAVWSWVTIWAAWWSQPVSVGIIGHDRVFGTHTLHRPEDRGGSGTPPRLPRMGSVRKRYTRSGGEQYSDMIGLVSKMQIAPRLGLLLSDVCSQPGCTHVLTVEHI
jgi:hypothetical protein